MKSVVLSFGLIFVSILLVLNSAQAAPSTFELQDNRIIIQVYINGQGPFHMMFDTGATNILSNEVAGALNLNQYDRFPISGGGENTLYASYCDVQSLDISDQVVGRSRFICMDVADMRNAIGFPRLDGLIGYEVFSQFLTEINFDKMQFSLHSFSKRSPLTASEYSVPLSFQGTMPCIDAVLDGIPGKFWLDTGDRASATLSLPFIQRHSLRQKYNTPFSTMTGYGLGGPMITSMTFASELHLGGLVFSDTLIRLPDMNSKALSDPATAGTIGTGLLRQFNILFDYSRREMVLSKNSRFAQDRSFDRSGMWIAPSADGFVIMHVLEKGPAWNAGLRVGQQILSVDGQTASEIDVLSLREKLKDRTVKQVIIKVQDGPRWTAVSIYLRDLVTPP